MNSWFFEKKYISWLCALKGSRKSDTPLAMSIPNARSITWLVRVNAMTNIYILLVLILCSFYMVTFLISHFLWFQILYCFLFIDAIIHLSYFLWQNNHYKINFFNSNSFHIQVKDNACTWKFSWLWDYINIIHKSAKDFLGSLSDKNHSFLM